MQKISSAWDILVILCDLILFVRNLPKILAIFQCLQENTGTAEEDQHNHRSSL
jgi:hypothetical protein